MLKKRWLFGCLTLGMILAGCMLFLFIGGNRQAEKVQDEVVRFHVVARSDSARDQSLKIKVRNGLFSLLEEWFADCETRGEALQTACARKEELELAAEEILQENGCDEQVTVTVEETFFPTKTYGSFSFPAGNYRAVNVRIGEARGKNFWCVLYPALCLAPAVAQKKAEDLLTPSLGKDGVDFLKKTGPKQRIRFALAEWLAFLKQKYVNS